MNHPNVAKSENVKVEGALIIECGIKSQLHSCIHTCIHIHVSTHANVLQF